MILYIDIQFLAALWLIECITNSIENHKFTLGLFVDPENIFYPVSHD